MELSKEFLQLLHLLYGFGQGVIEKILKKFVPVLLHLLYGFGLGVIDFLRKFVPVLLHRLYDFCGFLTEALNRRTIIIAIALALLFLCGRRGGGGRAAGKIMKAPGSGGRRMPRASFESNPRGYFRSLRAGK
ncbi:hypothetical protein COCNU_scaffold038379G000010 [Cocos nucifera]|nr:hypothetical protein [Cocos nucifera]